MSKNKSWYRKLASLDMQGFADLFTISLAARQIQEFTVSNLATARILGQLWLDMRDGRPADWRLVIQSSAYGFNTRGLRQDRLIVRYVPSEGRDEALVPVRCLSPYAHYTLSRIAELKVIENLGEEPVKTVETEAGEREALWEQLASIVSPQDLSILSVVCLSDSGLIRAELRKRGLLAGRAEGAPSLVG